MNDFVLALEKLRGQTCFKSRTKDVKQDLLPKGPGKSNTGSDERPFLVRFDMELSVEYRSCSYRVRYCVERGLVL